MSEDLAVTQEDIKGLKAKVNKSMESLVRLVLQVKKRIDVLDERLEIYNRKAGHKI